MTASTITNLDSVVTGGSPYVNYSIYHGVTRFSNVNEVVTGGITVISQTTGSSTATFDDATIPAGSFVWAYINSVSGASTIEIFMNYVED
jgi:hypothetical protein